MVEVNLCNTTSIRVRVACSADQLTQLLPVSESLLVTSSMQLTMTIRRSLTPTTFIYPCRQSLTNEHRSSEVECLDRGGREGMGEGLGGCYLYENGNFIMKLSFDSHDDMGTLLVSGIFQGKKKCFSQ